MSLAVNYDTLNWQVSNDYGNTLIREKYKQKQMHLYFHRRTASESRETCKMDAQFPPQGNYVPSALVRVAQGRFVFRVVDVELRALNWHNPWQIVIDGRKINHMAKASGQLLSESKTNTWSAYHQPKLKTRHDMTLSVISIPWTGWEIFLAWLSFPWFCVSCCNCRFIGYQASFGGEHLGIYSNNGNIYACISNTCEISLRCMNILNSIYEWIWICNFFLKYKSIFCVIL